MCCTLSTSLNSGQCLEFRVPDISIKALNIFPADPQQASDEACQGYPTLQLPAGDGHAAAWAWKIPDDSAASLRRVSQRQVSHCQYLAVVAEQMSKLHFQ